MANGAASRRVPTVRPRVYPAGRAVILLAVCAPELAGRRLAIEGNRIVAVGFGRLALLLTFVDQHAYSLEEIERKRTDASWLNSQARLLEQAVERARASVAVLPMRLLTVFPHSGALEEAALEHYARWSRALTRLGPKRECVVHLYAGPHAPPGGEPYLVRISQRSSRTARLPAIKADPAVVAHALALWGACTRIATATRRVQTGSRRGALWSAALLVNERDVAALAALVRGSAENGARLGLSAYIEIPRAPFTFV
jgi:hypothetical protein